MTHAVEVQRLTERGFGRFVGAQEPLSLSGARAIAAWNFCDGWRPERLLLFAERVAVDDMAELVELLDVIRMHAQNERSHA